jgi:hypothetical protein
MKRGIWMGLLSGLIYLTGYAQTQNQTGTTVTSAELKAALQQKTSYNPATGNALTASITNRLTPVLQLTSDQQQKMNGALYTYFSAKAPYVPMKRTDPAGYQQQQTTLFNTLQTNLSGFLTGSQLSRFAASKPASSHASDILTLVFY